MTTIKSKIITGLIVAVVVGSTGLILFLSTALRDLSKKNTVHSLEIISTSIFQTMRNGMNTGDPAVVESIIHDAKGDMDGLEDLSVFKAQSVENLFGVKNLKPLTQEVELVFNSKHPDFIEVDENGNHLIRLLKPFIATAQCTTCHTNTQVGDVLGVIEIDMSLEKSDIMINSSLFYLTLILAGGLIIAHCRRPPLFK